MFGIWGLGFRVSDLGVLGLRGFSGHCTHTGEPREQTTWKIKRQRALCSCEPLLPVVL